MFFEEVDDSVFAIVFVVVLLFLRSAFEMVGLDMDGPLGTDGRASERMCWGTEDKGLLCPC